mmetsp:Transcript_6879/g.41953  ORF Transcript_6879/g.41953 Transcript_6879/m.41953 type:complete len:219 (-) Transcript_6879:1258-1914(-)
MAIQESAFILKEMKGNGQEPPHNMRESVAQLIKKRLKRVLRLVDSHCTGSTDVIHTIVNFIYTTSIHHLFTRNGRACHLPNHMTELRHCPVILSTTKQPHVGIGECGIVRKRLAIHPNKCAAPDMLVRNCLSKLFNGCIGRALHEELYLREEPLSEASSLLLQFVSVKVIELIVNLPELSCSQSMFFFQKGNNARYVLKVTALENLLQEAPELRNANP